MIWIYSARSLQSADHNDVEAEQLMVHLKTNPVLQRVEIWFVPGDPSVLDISATCIAIDKNEFATRCMFDTCNDEWMLALAKVGFTPKFVRSEIKAYHASE